MIDENGGWFIKNVRDADWYRRERFATRCRFEPADARWAGTGIGISVLEPGRPACLYHRESAQEDFLVLSGECLLLVNGEEHRLRAWDFVHCPPGVSHVFVGAGNGPCAVLMIGDRPPEHSVFYPQSELARRHGAEAPEPTADPRTAYAHTERPMPCDPPAWPLDG